MFDESSKKQIAKLDNEGKPVLDEEENIILEDSADTQYGRIRMADIGIRRPRLKVNDIIFDVSYYYKPLPTYEKIFKEAKNIEILAEVTLSRGIAYLLEQNYLKSRQRGQRQKKGNKLENIKSKPLKIRSASKFPETKSFCR